MDIFNTKENIKLLLKYVTELRGEKKAKQLIRKHRNNLFGKNSLAAATARQSFPFFCLYYLQDFFVSKPTNSIRKLAPVHYEIWNVLDDMFIKNTHEKQQFILSRGIGKSTIINMALTTYAHLFNHSTFSIILANKQSDAEEAVEKTKLALQTPYIINSFGNLVVPGKRTVNQTELELDNNTKITAVSAENSPRGLTYTTPQGKISRPELVIADDYISEKDVLTDQAKTRKYDKWLKEVEEAGDEAEYRDGVMVKPPTRFIVIGTPLARGDFIDLIKQNPEYELFHRGVLDFDADDYFTKNKHWLEFRRILFDPSKDGGKVAAEQYFNKHADEMKFPVLWEGKYNHVKLASKYYSKRLAFMQELMCSIENIGEKWFDKLKLQNKENIESNKFVKTMITIDTAGTKNAKSSSANNFAFVVGSMGDNDFKYVRKAELRRFDDYDQYIRHAVDLIKEFPDVSEVYIEKNYYKGQDAEQIEKLLNEEQPRRNVTFTGEFVNKNKDVRISTCVPEVNNGAVIFCKERVEKKFIDEVENFAGQKYSLGDDAPDALAEFINRIEHVKARNRRLQSLDRRLFGI